MEELEPELVALLLVISWILRNEFAIANRLKTRSNKKPSKYRNVLCLSCIILYYNEPGFIGTSNVDLLTKDPSRLGKSIYPYKRLWLWRVIVHFVSHIVTFIQTSMWCLESIFFYIIFESIFNANNNKIQFT